MGFYWVMIVILAPLLIWGMISPRGQWKAMSSWQFRNPAANEPSDAAFAVQRVVSGITLVLIVAMGFVIQNAVEESRENSYEQPSYSDDSDYSDGYDDEYGDDEYGDGYSCNYDDPGWPNC